MARQDITYATFNRGIVSRLGLVRSTDIKRVALSAELFNNYMPRVLGSMSIRPGRKYLGSTAGNNSARFLPFVFSSSDKALLELTDLKMRVWVNDVLVTRPAVTTAITNGTFNTDLTGWTDDDDVGATSSWVAPGYMQLVGSGTAAAAKRTQQVTVAAADQNKQHALRIVIVRGPVTLRVGSTAGEDDYISETNLETGTHSLTLTPTGDFFIRFQSRLLRQTWVDSIAIEAAGVMEIVTPWAQSVLGSIRTAASGDIIFCTGYRQYTIERRSPTSWSVVEYLSPDGPFRIPNVSPTTLTPSVLSGNGTLTASTPLFKSTHVGALFRVTSTGQTVTSTATALNDATDSILVEGIGTDRAVTIVISGMTAGRTVVLQRSFDDASWVDVSGQSFTADTTSGFNDGLDNQSVYYRLMVSVAGAAGSTVMTLDIATGSISGICRVTAFTSSTVVDMEVLQSFGDTAASNDWAEGRWSPLRGYPTSVKFYEGRLGWFGKDTAALTASDNFYSYDDTIEGDSGPIVRSIGSGPVDTINWALSLQRLLLGGQGAEFSCRSTSFDEILTPTNFNIKTASRQGSANVEAVEIDSSGIFVQRGGIRIFELSFSGETLDYASTHLSALVPEIGKPGITRMAVQRQPDTRVHFVRSDGTVAILVFDKVENVSCFVTLSIDAADGVVEDVVVLPGDDGDDEDFVYYVVKYTINGQMVRYLEKWAFQDDCLGDSNLCLLADSFITYSGSDTTTVSAPHLAGEQVVIWADGNDVGTDDDGSLMYTLDGSGNVTLPNPMTNYVVGLPYMARWRSGKLGQLQTQIGLALKAHKTLADLGVILADTHRFGVKFGPDFDHLDDMPSMESGMPVGDDTVHTDYDEEMFPFPGTYTIDQRVCLQSQAPRPATMLAIVIPVEHHA